jgi:hypothetical protein
VYQKHRLAWLTAAVVLMGAPTSSAAAPTAKQVIERHVKAAGGARALGSVRGVRLSGTVNGNGEFLWVAQAPNAYYLARADYTYTKTQNEIEMDDRGRVTKRRARNVRPGGGCSRGTPPGAAA